MEIKDSWSHLAVLAQMLLRNPEAARRAAWCIVEREDPELAAYCRANAAVPVPA